MGVAQLFLYEECQFPLYEIFDPTTTAELPGHFSNNCNKFKGRSNPYSLTPDSLLLDCPCYFYALEYFYLVAYPYIVIILDAYTTFSP